VFERRKILGVDLCLENFSMSNSFTFICFVVSQKFKWEAVIKKLLKSAPDKEMAVKKLRKKVICVDELPWLKEWRNFVEFFLTCPL
jgi:hypothetical protein